MRRALQNITAVTAMAVPLAGIAPLAAGAATADGPAGPTAAHLSAGPAPAASPTVDMGCSTPGFKYTVKDTGIHIRKSPGDNGTSASSIPKGATFLSELDPENSLGFVCVTNSQFNGTFWVYGENPSHPDVNGWVGVNFMTFDASGGNF